MTKAWHGLNPLRLRQHQIQIKRSPPVIVQVYEGSPVTLNRNYSLTSGLDLGVIRFNSDGIVIIQADGSARPVTAKFRERFSSSSTLGRASLSISPVTVADDKAIRIMENLGVSYLIPKVMIGNEQFRCKSWVSIKVLLTIRMNEWMMYF